MSTLVALTGFEYGTDAGIGAGLFDGVTGTVGTDVRVLAGAAYEGSYGLQVNLTGKGPFWTTATLGTAKTSLVVSLRFRLTTLPTGDTDIISMDSAATTDRAGFFYRASDGKLVAWAGGVSQASTATISVNTWYLLEWHLDVSANPNVMSWRLDGTAGTQVSLGVAASTISRLMLGNRSVGTGVANYDAVVVSVTGADHPLGAHSIKILTVDPAGTVTSNSTTNFRAFTSNGTIDGAFDATNIRNAIDELPPTIGASADGAVQISNNATGYIEIPMTTYTLGSGETIAGARMLACGWAADTTAAIIEFRSFNGTTETVLFAAADPQFDASTTVPTWVCRMLTLADIDTQSELNALAFRMGFSTDAAPDVGVHAIYAEVAVLSSGGTTVTPATVAAVAAVPTATVLASSVVSPATVAAVVGVGTATVQLSVVITPATVAAVAAVPAPTVVASSVVSVATVAAVAAVPAVTVQASSTVQPATVAAVAGVGAPSVTTGGSVTVQAVTVAAVGAVGTVTVQASVTVSPATVAAAAAVGAPALNTGSTAVPATVAATAAVGVPIVQASVSVTVPTVAATAGVPGATVQASSTVAVAPVAAVTGVGAVTVSVTSSATVTVATVATTVAVPDVVVDAALPLPPAPVLVHVADGLQLAHLAAAPLPHILPAPLVHVGDG